MAFSLKTKALFFIFLLAGQEAARIKTTPGLVQSAGVEDPQTDWQNENNACTWSTMNLGCVGHQREVIRGSACAFRYLPLDNLPPFSSESCRLRDEYMLATDDNRAKYFQLQAEVLAVKARKFKEECKDEKFWHLKCKRRAKHMFRAITFMSKAQDESLIRSLTEEQRDKDRELFQESLDHMAEFAGKDMSYVMMLKEKMAANKAGFKAKPMESTQEVLRLLTMLLQGKEEQQAEARKTIEEMPSSSTDEDELAEDRTEDVVRALEAEKQKLNREIDEQAGDLDDEEGESNTVLQTIPTQSNNTGALLQEAATALLNIDDATVVKGIAFIVIVALVISAIVWVVAELIAVLVTWAVLTLLGCGIYAAAKDSNMRDEDKMGVTGWLTCVGTVFIMPFKAVYKGGKAVYRFFWPKKKEIDSAKTSLMQIEGGQATAEKGGRGGKAKGGGKKSNKGDQNVQEGANGLDQQGAYGPFPGREVLPRVGGVFDLPHIDADDEEAPPRVTELRAKKLSELQQLARSLGVSEADRDEALDAEDIAEAFIALILEAEFPAEPEATCASHTCSTGWVKKADIDSTVGDTDAVCCDEEIKPEPVPVGCKSPVRDDFTAQQLGTSVGLIHLPSKRQLIIKPFGQHFMFTLEDPAIVVRGGVVTFHYASDNGTTKTYTALMRPDKTGELHLVWYDPGQKSRSFCP